MVKGHLRDSGQHGGTVLFLDVCSCSLLISCECVALREAKIIGSVAHE